MKNIETKEKPLRKERIFYKEKTAFVSTYMLIFN